MNPRLWRGEWDSNPRVLTNMGLAIPRPTRLGDPRFIDYFLVRVYELYAKVDSFIVNCVCLIIQNTLKFRYNRE